MPGDISDPTAISEQVAGVLRAEILDGTRPAGSEMESQKDLGLHYGYSEATMNRALAELAREGLVRMGSGRRTVVLAHDRYRVTVTVPAGGKVTRAELGQISRRLRAQEAAGRVTGARLSPPADVVTAEATVVAADAGRAAMTGLQAVKEAAAADWDFTRAAVTAEPAT